MLVTGLSRGRVPLCATLLVVLFWGAMAWPQPQAPVQQGSTPIVLRPPQPLPAELVGRPVIRLEVITDGGRWQTPITLRRSRLGELLSAAYARRIVRELLDTGQYAEASASAFAAPDGVVLKLTLVPRRIVTEVRIVGGVLDDVSTRQAAGVDADDDVTQSALPIIAGRVRALYAERGFPSATVSVAAVDTDEPLKVLVEIDIAAGPALRVDERRFEVQPAPSPELSELSDTYAVERGDRMDTDSLKQADAALARRLRLAGYHQAAVLHRVERVNGRGVLRVNVQAGAKTSVRFEGNKSFDKDELSLALELDADTEWNPSTLPGKVRQFYVKRGFLDVEVELERRAAVDGSTLELVFEIRERGRVAVRARHFACLSGKRSAAEVAAEIDSFLSEALPGAGLFSAVSSHDLDRRIGSQATSGQRAEPLELDPWKTYDPAVYDRALEHVRDLYRSEGYLSASVGPVIVLRRACDKRSPPNQCWPVGAIHVPDVACTPEADGSFADTVLEPAVACSADPKRGVHCEPSVLLQIPVRLGPRAHLWDIEFEGNRALVESELHAVTELTLGGPVSQVELENARRRLVERYAEDGFVFAGIEVDLDLSPDRTRAKARFIISERQPVTVSAVVVKGARFTQQDLILKRSALKPGELYRQSLVRATEERLATLGVFTSVNVDLEDPEVPAQRKVVVIHVSERLPQYIDLSPGFSTGEGVRIAFEYGHTNMAERAIRLIVRIQLGYLPPPLIIEPKIKRRFDQLLDQESVLFLLERRNSVSLEFPEIGLGPLFRLALEGVDVRDISSDWALEKRAAIATVSYRPSRAFNVSLGGSLELNQAIFFSNLLQEPGVEAPESEAFFRIPDGLTFAVAERAGFTWDRRDNAFSATRGTLLSVNLEHVNAYPLEDSSDQVAAAGYTSNFMHYTGRVAGYLRLTARGMALATSLRWGLNQQLSSRSHTYPDRWFFLGGVDSLRGFSLWSVAPEDSTPEQRQQEVPNGGDVLLNPRAELRIPLSGIWQTGVFLDTGNVWIDPDNVFSQFRLRYAAGAGLRIDTPVGPLALDYGFNLARRSNEDVGAFHFSIGLF